VIVFEMLRERVEDEVAVIDIVCVISIELEKLVFITFVADAGTDDVTDATVLVVIVLVAIEAGVLVLLADTTIKVTVVDIVGLVEVVIVKDKAAVLEVAMDVVAEMDLDAVELAVEEEVDETVTSLV
jgi:hypothetical protein